MSNTIITDFIAAVNRKYLRRLSLLTDIDCCLIDSYGNQSKGKSSILQKWVMYLDWFPDYHITIDVILNNKSTFAVFGFSDGTFQVSFEVTASTLVRLPVAIRAEVKEHKIVLLQFYSDTQLPIAVT